eukprot:g2065.t1
MEFFKISTVTEQFPNQLAQGKGGKVVLAGEGDVWILENIFTTEGGDNRAIIAPRLGMLQALASLAPVFKQDCSEPQDRGEVRLSLEDENDRFPWRFEMSGGGDGLTISAREESIPDGVVLPSGGKVFLVWEGTEVKWAFGGGVVPAVPPNALWRVEKVEQPKDTLEQVKISLFTPEFVLPPERFISQEDGGAVALAAKGDTWLLRSSSTGSHGASKGGPPSPPKVNTILAPNLGSLNVLAQLAPIFPAMPPSACDEAEADHSDKPAHDDAATNVEQRGDLRLSIAAAGEEYPWTFVQQPEGGVTITGQAPPGLGFPEGGRVYLVWELPNAVKWQFAGGFVEEIPPRATWVVAPTRDDACAGGTGETAAGGVERAPVASSAPPASGAV